MSEQIEFGYYYGIEAEQFAFYRVPRLLIKDERFKGLSSDAKLLYGLLLDRMSLSMKNGWLDDKNRAYIVYAIDEMMEDLGCSKPTCLKVLKELDSENGIGLVEKVRRGLGKPDIIYVKNFASVMTENDPERELSEAENTDKTTEVKNLYFKKSKSFTSESKEILPQEVKNLDLCKSNNFTSESKETLPQEVKEFYPNNTNNNYTEMSYTDSNHINLSYGGRVSLKERIAEKEKLIDGMDRNKETEALIALIKKNIDYDNHMAYDAYDERKLYEEMFLIIVDVVCVKKGTIRIEGQDYPQEIVKSRFLKLDSDHLEYVRDSLGNTNKKIGNIKRYLLTALYNAPETYNHYYRQAAQYDMYGSGEFYNNGISEKMKDKYKGAI
ncbi:MAG: replication initiator protein A [Lachnospiraceae bacterium]|nr:replication initiator protein A [Lachnospiraceae bacterium]